MHDLRDSDLAEEVAQESLTRLVLALREGRLQNPAHLGAFTRAIARHVIVDMLRARQRLAATGPTAEPASDEDSLGAMVSAEQAARVHSALERLSAGDRQILRLSFFEGLTPQQVAERVGEPSPRVRKRKERALERLASGTYGLCEGCGQPIDVGRLRVVPSAIHCQHCAPDR